MSDLQQQFEAAAAASKQLSRRPDNQTLLTLDALQAGHGGRRRGAQARRFDLVGGAEHDAWAALNATTPEDAMQQYVVL